MKTSRSHGLNASSVVEKLMQTSKVQADDVADVAIDAARKNRLYALPHLEGRFVWAAKRLAPGLFHGFAAARAAKRFSQ